MPQLPTMTVVTPCESFGSIAGARNHSDVVMRVNVDKAGGQRQSFCLDYNLRVVIEARTNLANEAVSHGNIQDLGGATAAVQDACIPNQGVTAGHRTLSIYTSHGKDLRAKTLSRLHRWEQARLNKQTPPQSNASAPISPLNKGLGFLERAIRRDEIAPLGWNLLREDLSLPSAVLYEDRLLHNLNWMQQFIAAYGVKLAPHGKTTMAPRLFDLQLQAGAWGITLATAHQALGCPRARRAPSPDGEPTHRQRKYGHHRAPSVRSRV